MKKRLSAITSVVAFFCLVTFFPQTASAKAPGAGPVDFWSIYSGVSIPTPATLAMNWSYVPIYQNNMLIMVANTYVDGARTDAEVLFFDTRVNYPNLGTSQGAQGAKTLSLGSPSPGAHNVSVTFYIFEISCISITGGACPSMYREITYSVPGVIFLPAVPSVTMLMNGLPWNVAVPETNSPFTLQINGTNNPTQCYIQTTNASGQTAGYQPFPCNQYATAQTVRPNDFGFTAGDNFMSVYMVNAVGVSSTVSRVVSVNPLPVATVLLNGQGNDVTVSTTNSPFTLQITGTNSPTQCFIEKINSSGGTTGSEPFPCNQYLTPQIVRPNDFGFTDTYGGHNRIRVYMENANGPSEPVLRAVDVRPIPEVTFLLNGAPQNITIPTLTSTFSLKIEGTFNPDQCEMWMIGSSGTPEGAYPFDCTQYNSPAIVSPNTFFPFLNFVQGSNTLEVHARNTEGEGVASRVVRVGTFTPSVSVLVNGLPQDTTLATPTSSFTYEVTATNSPTSCYESRYNPISATWTPYISMLPPPPALPPPGVNCSNIGQVATYTPATRGLVTGANGFRYYMTNTDGDSPITTRYITVPSPATATLSANPTTCSIPSGGTTCNIPFTWNISGASVPNLFNSTTGAQYSNGSGGVNNSFPITYGVNTVQARDGGAVLRAIPVTGTCASSSWNGTMCVAPTATLSANPASCTILSGGTTCNIPFTWNISNATTPNLTNSTRGVQYTTNASGNAVSYLITNGANVVQARDGTNVLSAVTVTGTCASGTTWTGGICTPSGPPTVAISASPTRVRPGASATVLWNTTNVTSCSVTRNGSALSSALSSAGTSATNITTQTVFKITCTGTDGSTNNVSSAVVNTTGSYSEF